MGMGMNPLVFRVSKHECSASRRAAVSCRVTSKSRRFSQGGEGLSAGSGWTLPQKIFRSFDTVIFRSELCLTRAWLRAGPLDAAVRQHRRRLPVHTDGSDAPRVSCFTSSPLPQDANTPTTVYTVRFETGQGRGAGLSEFHSGVNLCLVGRDAAVMHRISPINDPSDAVVAMDRLCEVISYLRLLLRGVALVALFTSCRDSPCRALPFVRLLGA